MRNSNMASCDTAAMFAYGITTVHSKRLIEKVKLLFKNEKKPMGHEKLHLDKKMLLTATKDGNLS